MRCRATLTAVIAAAAIFAIAPAANAAVVTDSFTGTNGTLLENHVGETGAIWSYHPNYGADLKLQDGRVWGPEWGLYFASGVPPTAEYDVRADLHVKSNAGAIGLVARASTSGTDQLYMARYAATTGSWELIKCANGGCTGIGPSYPQTLTAGTTYALKLEVRNGTKKLFVDGIQRISSTDNAITQVGRAGIRSGPGVTSATTGFHLDNFTVDAAATDTQITSGPNGLTNNASPSFSFTSTPSGGAFECKLDGPGTATGTFATCTTPRSYPSLANGSYTFSVRATVGGVTDSTPATRAFTVDTAPPETNITSGPSGTITTNSATFSFTSPDGTSFECKLDGPGTATGTFATCPSPQSYPSLANGSYTFSVRALDAAGNTDASAATRAFTVNVGGGTQCSDGTDNDGDGQTDFGSDPHCHSTADNNESAPSYNVTFQDSFELTPFPKVQDTGAWNSAPLIDPSGSATAYVRQVTPTTYSPSQGLRVAEAHVGGTDTRAELSCHKGGTTSPRCAAAEGTEWHYEFDVRVPAGQNLPTGAPGDAPAGIMQTGPTGGPTGCYAGSMRALPSTQSGRYRLIYQTYGGSCSNPIGAIHELGHLTTNEWHHIYLHAKWGTTASTGFSEVEVDGVKVMPLTNLANHMGGGLLAHFRLGIYRAPAPAAPGKAATFQYDNLRLGVP